MAPHKQGSAYIPFDGLNELRKISFPLSFFYKLSLISFAARYTLHKGNMCAAGLNPQRGALEDFAQIPSPLFPPFTR